jgi:hypothetical protein
MKQYERCLEQRFERERNKAETGNWVVKAWAAGTWAVVKSWWGALEKMAITK